MGSKSKKIGIRGGLFFLAFVLLDGKDSVPVEKR